MHSGIRFALLAACLFPYFLQAQQAQIQGKVLQQDNNNPLEFANISLLTAADSSFVTGTFSEIDGSFELQAAEGSYLIEVRFIGFEATYLAIEVQDSKRLKLDPILVYSDAEMLDEVTVTSMRSMFQSDIDKRVYNMDNNVLAQGGTAIDVLETIPSVQVDEEGNISMRGSGNIVVLINGRPSSISGDDTESILAQFPANSIKSIEIITNPSSRYDAAGVGGIINIILKENERRGLNGQVEVSAGTRNKYTAGINLNYGLPKVNFFLNYNYQYRNRFTLGETRRISKVAGEPALLDQDFDTEDIRQVHLLRTGMDYRFNDRLSSGLYLQGNRSTSDRVRLYNQRFIDAESNLDSLYERTLLEDRLSNNLEGGVYFDWNIDTSGQRLYFTGSYSADVTDRIELMEQLYYVGSDANLVRSEDQRYGRPRQNNLAVLQLDYTLPIAGSGQLEAGLKTTAGAFDLDQSFEILQDNNTWRNIDTVSNSFEFNETVHAAYLIYRDKLGRFSYQAGLRGEMALTNSLEGNTQNTVENNYFNLFPSVYLSYERQTGEAFFLNYSRRINRPSTWGLAPFYNVQDPLNMRLGNPYLQPELTDSYEVGYDRDLEFLMITGTLYHRRTEDVLSRIFVPGENNSVIMTWENANSSINNGLEIINQFFVTKWMDLTVSGNAFHARIFGENIQSGFVNENFSWSASLLGSFRAGNWGTFQLQGNYRGPVVRPQGELLPMYGINAGYRKDFWDRRATLSISVSDIFNTRIFRVSVDDPSFSQTREFNWETRIGTITFNYRFGGFNNQERKERNGGGEMGGGDDF